VSALRIDVDTSEAQRKLDEAVVRLGLLSRQRATSQRDLGYTYAEPLTDDSRTRRNGGAS